ncbi:VrrA/YqfQ family protein [Bacillus methanolicus]|uniref:YqfQ-like protein n=1 Tax=Bacillus methanolicus (strain MGA3 / ATCC 53907) TaxID=796606 RepID=I3EAK7_BACMM|nr:VrrA/YqfQ family protein [Bacillus methanolicus]AIE60767.1 hypothetical protein BMMGA3_11860 [Bacillus methanolicus MGA3]EIJ83528.1 hypothetical protein MGA3_09920 [Bacillus methanolicus MGA3]
MPPRQRGPFSMGMGPRYMHSSPVSPFGPLRGRPPQIKRGGGLLEKILGLGNRNSPVHGMQSGGFPGRNLASSPSAPGGSSILKTLSNPQAVNGFLNNTQQVLKAAQSIGPIIQQYGPIAKNLPAMWKLYRGFKNAKTDTETSDHESVDQTTNKDTEKSTENKSQKRVKKKKTSSKKEKASSAKRQQKKESVPKLYI